MTSYFKRFFAAAATGLLCQSWICSYCLAADTVSSRHTQLDTSKLASLQSSIWSQNKATQPPQMEKNKALKTNPVSTPTSTTSSTQTRAPNTVSPETNKSTQSDASVAEDTAINKPIPWLAILASPSERALAKDMDLLPTIQQLSQLKGNDSETQIQRLKLTQRIDENLLVATLQVRDVTARIDRQINVLNRAQRALEDRRDKGLKYNTLSNIFGLGAIAEVGQVGELRANEVPGEEIEIVGIGITIALGLLSLWQQRGGTTKVSRSPNLLAPLLGLPNTPETNYPPMVWNYLNSVPLTNSAPSQTRLQTMIARWQMYGLLPAKGSAQRMRAVANIDQTKANIGLLDDQASMLADVRTEVFQMDSDLLSLMMHLQTLSRNQPDLIE